ncbi:MAG: hypothetical protein ACK53L_06360, partial [Pirellulaceae bacterium]
MRCYRSVSEGRRDEALGWTVPSPALFTLLRMYVQPAVGRDPAAAKDRAPADAARLRGFAMHQPREFSPRFSRCWIVTGQPGNWFEAF